MKGALPSRQTLARPQPVRGRDEPLAPPVWLPDTARSIFEEAARGLAATRGLIDSDAELLGFYALACAEARRGFERMAELDPASGDHKRAKASALGMLDRAIKIASDFGLAPLPRLRYGVGHLEGLSLIARLERGSAAEVTP
jgi:phage terminase small subunit